MRSWKAAIFLLVLALTVAPAAAEPRIALVIGNARYTAKLDPLANPVNDSKVIASALRAAGFEVELVTDADRVTMHRALERLRDRIVSAGPEATALFYYAGHGMQSGEINYLAPVDTASLEQDGVTADTAVLRMEEAGARTKLIILDACRDSPAVRAASGGARGFRRVNALERGGGLFVAYSTAVGQIAADGQGPHSPFAAALAREIVRPGQPIETMARVVRTYVVYATNGQQTPWDSNSLTAPFAFVPDAARLGPVDPTIGRLDIAAPPALVPASALPVTSFETVATAEAPRFMVAAAPYLRSGPLLVRVRDVSPAGSEVVFVNNRGVYEGNYAAPTVSQNFLTQISTGNVAASFTLLLPRPVRRVHFLTPRLFPDTESGVTAPAWRATALGTAGEALDTRERPLARSMTVDIPSDLVSLDAGPSDGIAAVRFESDPRLRDANGNLFPFAATSALMLEGMWIEPLD